MNKYLNKEHFNQVMIGEFTSKYANLFDHSERLSSKAYLFSSGSNIAIIYVDTIVFLLVNNKIKLNTDGWFTNTSKRWINKGLSMINGGYISQKNFQWYLNPAIGEAIAYQDNMIIQ